jgi:hypothetical protein
MDDDEDEDEEEILPRSSKQGTAGGFDASQSGISDLIDDSQGSASSPREISRERMLFFEQRLGAARKIHVDKGGDHDQMLLDDVMELVNLPLRGSNAFGKGEVIEFLKVLGDDNRVWYRESEELLMFM